MKKIILIASLFITTITTVNAEKKVVVSTYSIPGQASSVSVNHSTGAVSTNCDPCQSCVCQTGTITITTQDNVILNQHMTLDIIEGSGKRHRISGTLLESNQGILPNGSIQYNYQFNEMQTN